MRYWIWRVPLAALLAVVLVVGTLSAQDWVSAPGASTGTMAPSPTQAGFPDGKWFPYAPIEITESIPPPPRAPIANCLRKLNIGCYATVNSPGCGNLHTELTYIFGSCHCWYGQSCLAPPTYCIGQTGYGTTKCNCGP
jgi:hypothetical protein